MIYVLHGEDTAASYRQLSQIAAGYSHLQKVRLSSRDTFEDFYLNIFAVDLVTEKKLVVAENCLISKKITRSFLERIPQDKIVVFWEDSQLPASTVSQLPKQVIVQNFKQKSQLFWFLDSINPSCKKTLMSLQQLKSSDESKILWHLANRLLLLILAKQNIDWQIVVKITPGKIFDWQWAKITRQAKLFNLANLIHLFSSVLKIERMIKTGATNLDPKTLITLLFLRYLNYN